MFRLLTLFMVLMTIFGTAVIASASSRAPLFPISVVESLKASSQQDTVHAATHSTDAAAPIAPCADCESEEESEASASSGFAALTEEIEHDPTHSALHPPFLEPGRLTFSDPLYFESFSPFDLHRPPESSLS